MLNREELVRRGAAAIQRDHKNFSSFYGEAEAELVVDEVLGSLEESLLTEEVVAAAWLRWNGVAVEGGYSALEAMRLALEEAVKTLRESKND